MLKPSQLLAAAAACERAARAQSPEEQRAADYEVLCHREAIQVGLIQAEMAKHSQAPHALEALPLAVGNDDFGRVRRRMPAALFFHLMQQKNFGWDGMTSDEGQRDLDKAYPTTTVKTISGKCTVPVRANIPKASGRSDRRVQFGRGTLQLAG